MTGLLKRKWFFTGVLILFALWAMIFYRLVFTAWTLQYSVYGVVGVLAAVALFVYVFPRRDRRLVTRFALYCLVFSVGLGGLAGQSIIWTGIDYLGLLVVVLILGRLLIKLPVWQLLGVALALSLAELWVPWSDMSVLSAFSIRYIGHFNSQDKQVPSLPVNVVPNPTRPGTQEIITLRGHSPYPGEAQALFNHLTSNPATSAPYIQAVRELQHSYDVIAVRPGKLAYHTSYASPSELSKLSPSTLGLLDFPFTTSHFFNLNSQVRMYVTMSENPGQLFNALMQPGSLSDQIGALSVNTAVKEEQNWKSVTGWKQQAVDGLSLHDGYLTGTYHGVPVHVRTSGVALLGVYPLLPKSASSSPQAVLEGNNMIQVVSLPPGKPRIFATLHGSFALPLTTDVVFADLTGNGRYALLINTVPAQIRELTPQGTWPLLWSSARHTFRFETVFPRPGGDLIVANSPSLVSGSVIRYLGGYVYRNHALQTVWRVYHTDLVDLHTVHVTSPTQPELLTSLYSHQEIMLLAPTSIPWLPLSMAGYVVVIAAGVFRRWTAKRRGGQTA